MEALGEELYGIITQCYPELAPKLTGMILSLGEEECMACLDSQERLAERLDEAFRILDADGQCAKEPPPEEKRVDPEDGKARTFKELSSLCAGKYSMQEIEEYWRTMAPADGTGAAAPKAKAKAAGPAAPAKPGGSAPRAAASSAKPASGPGAPAAPAPVPAAEPDEALPGLTYWLRELKLSSYATAASKWIEEQGACSLDEVVENLEDFAESLSLKKLEQKRLMQSGEAAAKAAMEAAASAEPAPPAPPAEAAHFQREREAAQREQEELEREMEELRALQEEAEAIGTSHRGAPAAAKSSAAAKSKAPSVRVAPKAKAPAMTREEVEWNRENEREEREFQKKQQARQAAREAEAAAEAAEEKRQARAREAEERQQRAAAELATKVGSAQPGGAEAPAEDFPALGAGDWQAAAGGKKGRKKR